MDFIFWRSVMKQRNVIQAMVEIALFAAIGFVLDELQGAIAVSFPNGGSIGFAMIAVLIIAYRRGFFPALLTGLIIGAFDMATKAYLLHPLQVMFDYVLPYALVGFAGLFKPLFDNADTKGKKILWIIVGTLVGGHLKLLSHFIAGVVWWGDPEYFAWGLNDWNVYVYSLIYNMAFIYPSIVLCTVLMIILVIKAPIIFTVKGAVKEEASIKGPNKPIIFTSVMLSVGLFMFIYFLIRYVNSFYWKESSSKYYFNQDSMVNFVTGIAIILASFYSFFKIVKKKFQYRRAFIFMAVVLSLHAMYALSHIIDMYINKEPQYYYWIWFASSAVLIPVPTIFAIKEKKRLSSSQN